MWTSSNFCDPPPFIVSISLTQTLLAHMCIHICNQLDTLDIHVGYAILAKLSGNVFHPGKGM